MDCNTPGYPVLHYLPEFAPIHVHWVSDTTQLSHPLLPPSHPALNLNQHQGLFQLVSFTSDDQSIGASASASVLLMNIQGWFPLGLTSLISLQSKGLSRVLQRHNSKASIHWCSALTSIRDLHYGPTLTSIYDYWKYQGFDCMDLCQQSDVSGLQYAV